MFKIISDGGCDFTQAEIATHKIDVIPFYVSFDEEFLKIGKDITTDAFYQRLVSSKGVFPKTSQPNPQDYIDAYTPHLKAGYDLLVLTISSKLSGSYQSASIAADLLREEHPDREIILIDSLGGSIAQGLILREAIKMRDAGYTLGKTAQLTRKVQATTHVYFTLDTIEYLKRGGRIGQATAFVGNMLGLRPILHLVDGEIKQLDNVRGKKTILRMMQTALVEALADEKDNIQLSIGHISSEKDANGFKENTEGTLGIQIDNPICAVGAVIGAHAGPGALAVAYCKKYEAVEAALEVESEIVLEEEVA